MVSLLQSTFLLDKLDIEIPLLGVYDAPNDDAFSPIVEPLSERKACIFAYYNAWKRGLTLKLSSIRYGCGGSGYWLLGKENRTLDERVEFLCGYEGLKSCEKNMRRWLEVTPVYSPKYKMLFIGPLKSIMFEYLKSVTFFVNPDQLSALIIAANYFHNGEGESPVSAPFGSGCSQILPLMNLEGNEPKAIVGGTDLAMRKYLPANTMAFTVNLPMFKQLCSLGKDSFMDKSFMLELKEARNGSF